MTYLLPYSKKLSLDKKISPSFDFHPCGNGCHRLYVIIDMGQKIHGIKSPPMKEGGKFPQVKILFPAIATGFKMANFL